MKKNYCLTIILFILVAGLFTGCDVRKNPYTLTSDKITGIWVETLPAKSDSQAAWSSSSQGERPDPKYTDDKEIIDSLISYVNSLQLKPRTEKDETMYGMSMRIEISYADGSKREFWHSGNVYFSESGSDKQYVMKYDQAEKFESEIYAKMQTATIVKGIVEQASEGENNYKALLVNVDSTTQQIVGDKTTVSVKADRVYKGNLPDAEVNAGDKIKFYVDGGVRESYPTQCTAWKVTVLSTDETSETTTKPPAPALVPEDSNPYYVLFKQLFADDPGLNGDIKYLAIDISKVKSKDNTDFLALMQDYCKKEGLTLLEDSIDGLKEKGMIKDLYFENGIVISFEDTSLSDKKLVTKAQKWRSGLGAIGGTFTLELKKGFWSITKTENQWIS